MDAEYRAGAVLKVIDYYAFPRTGSHFLGACISGLFDHVTILPAQIRTDPEAMSRRDELSELALYALDLREAGVPFQPVWFNVLRNGPHGMPIPGENPILIVIRHPLAAAYSAWRSRFRLGWAVETPAEMKAHLDRYESFYDASRALSRTSPDRVLLLRYEDLIANFEPLERLVSFVGLRPKLAPRFVHWVTRFENFVKPGERSFYRGGDDGAWRNDADFRRLLSTSAAARDYSRFGYTVDRAEVSA